MIVQAGGLGQRARGLVPATQTSPGLTHSLVWLPDHQLWTMVLSLQRIKEENGFVLVLNFNQQTQTVKKEKKKNT